MRKLVNHDPQASDLQAFRVYSQHPKWFYYAGKLLESAVYCFYEITTWTKTLRNRRFLFCNLIKLFILFKFISKAGEPITNRDLF